MCMHTDSDAEDEDDGDGSDDDNGGGSGSGDDDNGGGSGGSSGGGGGGGGGDTNTVRIEPKRNLLIAAFSAGHLYAPCLGLATFGPCPTRGMCCSPERRVGFF